MVKTVWKHVNELIVITGTIEWHTLPLRSKIEDVSFQDAFRIPQHCTV